MTRTGAAAIAHARGEIANPSKDWTGMCLQFVRSCFDVGPVAPSAIAGWKAARLRHELGDLDKIPAGVPVWWATGQFGHVALSIGDGKCISTDILRRGKPDVVAIGTIADRWGARFLGWSEDINGVRITTPPAPGATDEEEELMALEQKTLDQIRDAVLRAPVTANGKTASLLQHLAEGFVDDEAQSVKLAQMDARLSDINGKLDQLLKR